jgi:hypothetical protein
MKKFFSMMVAVAAMFTFAACEKSEPAPAGDQKLTTPVIEIVDVTESGFTVKWGAIQGAESYSVNMKGDNFSTTETSYTFTELNAGEYSVRVMAKGNGYKNSDFSTAKVVKVIGATSVSWFTQTLTLVPETDEYAAEGFFPYNAAEFSWKGTGVVDLMYGMFATEQLEGDSDADIIANLNTLGKNFDSIIESVNGDGATSVFEPLVGSTSYTLCTWVKNSEGKEFLAKSEVTTAPAVLTAEAEAWLGEWTGYTEKMLVFGQTVTTEDVRRDFTLSITAYPGYADVLLVDGFSELGTGCPAIGQVIVEDGKNILGLMAQQVIDELQGGMYLTWISYATYGGKSNFLLGDFPTYLMTMGESEGSMYSGKFEDEAGTPFTVEAMDLVGWDGNNGIGFLQDQNGNSYNKFKVGPIKGLTKAAATASVAAKKAHNYTVGNKIQASVVF